MPQPCMLRTLQHATQKQQIRSNQTHSTAQCAQTTLGQDPRHQIDQFYLILKRQNDELEENILPLPSLGYCKAAQEKVFSNQATE